MAPESPSPYGESNKFMTEKPQRLDAGWVAERLGLPDGPWTGDWQASEASWPESNRFLQKDSLKEACFQLGMAPEVSSLIQEHSTWFEQNPARQRFFCHCRHVLVETERYDFPHFLALPEPKDDHGMFFVFVFLAALPALREIHRRHAIPADIARDTLSDLELWIRTYRQWYGCWGFDERRWLFHHFRGKLYKLGRLQFLLDRLEDDLHLLRSQETSDLMMLAPREATYRPDGQFDGTNGVWAKSPQKADYREADETYKGIFIAPQGHITGKTVELRKSRWKEVLKKEDPALSFHIPATGPMDPGECWESFAQAAKFFPRHFPGQPFKAFFSHSWLYDPQLARYLPEQSNIVQFQRTFYLYPLQGANDKQIFERVFGPAFPGVHRAVAQTSLQKAVLEHVRSGGQWRTSGALLLPDRLPAISRTPEQENGHPL
jgi:hypothetical protein